MKERITISVDQKILNKVDKRIDGTNTRNRSHAIEQLLSKTLYKEGVKKAFILAGGEGTRLRPFTYEMPKALIPIKGKPLLEHVISHLADNGINQIILSLGYMSDKIISHFGNGKDLGVSIDYILEKEPLGTAGPLNLARELLDEPFLMLNGDILSKIDISDLNKMHKNSNAIGTISLVTAADPSRFGVVELKGNKVTGFVEKPKKGNVTSNLINAGFYLFDPKILDYVPKTGKSMMEKDVFPALAKEGKLVGYVYSGPWFDLGTTESYERAIKGWK